MATILTDDDRPWGVLGKVHTTYDPRNCRMVVRVRGDLEIRTNITEPTDFIIEDDGNLEVHGSVADNCRFYLLPKEQPKIGVLARCFGKTAEPPKQTSIFFAGNIGDNFEVQGSQASKLLSMGRIGVGCKININPHSSISLRDVGDGLNVRGAKSIRFQSLGNLSELYKCGHVFGESIGSGCSIIADTIKLNRVGEGCHFKADYTSCDEIGKDSRVEGVLKTASAPTTDALPHLRLVRAS